jgi:hypothetical protein
MREAEMVAAKVRTFVEHLREKQRTRLTTNDVRQLLDMAEMLPCNEPPEPFRPHRSSQLSSIVEAHDEGAYADPSPTSPTKPSRGSLNEPMSAQQERMVTEAMYGCESGVVKNAKGEPEVLLPELEAWITQQFYDSTEESSHEDTVSFLWHDLVTARNQARGELSNATAAEDKVSLPQGCITFKFAPVQGVRGVPVHVPVRRHGVGVICGAVYCWTPQLANVEPHSDCQFVDLFHSLIHILLRLLYRRLASMPPNCTMCFVSTTVT